jgi:hypothetical protein
MSPIADNRNLSGDKPIDFKNLEQANQPARHDQAKSGLDGRGLKAVPGTDNVPAGPPNTPQNVPSGAEVRKSIFSGMTRSKPPAQSDFFDAPEFEEKKEEQKETARPAQQNAFKEKTKEREKEAAVITPKTAAGSAQKKQEESQKKAELPKTIFGDKAYVKKGDLKYSLWKSDDLKKMTKLGRHDRADLAQEFFADRQNVRRDDVEQKIRRIESGKDKPPASLGTGRIARTRAVNVLRGIVGGKQKRVY